MTDEDRDIGCHLDLSNCPFEWFYLSFYIILVSIYLSPNAMFIVILVPMSCFCCLSSYDIFIAILDSISSWPLCNVYYHLSSYVVFFVVLVPMICLFSS